MSVEKQVIHAREINNVSEYQCWRQCQFGRGNKETGKKLTVQVYIIH